MMSCAVYVYVRPMVRPGPVGPRPSRRVAPRRGGRCGARWARGAGCGMRALERGRGQRAHPDPGTLKARAIADMTPPPARPLLPARERPPAPGTAQPGEIVKRSGSHTPIRLSGSTGTLLNCVSDHYSPARAALHDSRHQNQSVLYRVDVHVDRSCCLVEVELPMGISRICPPT
jgi:hypothetical protein